MAKDKLPGLIHHLEAFDSERQPASRVTSEKEQSIDRQRSSRGEEVVFLELMAVIQRLPSLLRDSIPERPFLLREHLCLYGCILPQRFVCCRHHRKVWKDCVEERLQRSAQSQFGFPQVSAPTLESSAIVAHKNKEGSNVLEVNI
jgi:hypothetical protein